MKYLFFLLCFIPFTASAAHYDVNGSGVCIKGIISTECSVNLAFDIDEADFGSEVRLLTTSGISLYDAGGFVASTPVLWSDDINSLPGFCTEFCAYAATNSIGNLLGFSFNSYGSFPFVTDGGLGAGINFWTGHIIGDDYDFAQGQWDTINNISIVPLPSALFLFGTVLFGGAFFRSFRSKS